MRLIDCAVWCDVNHITTDPVTSNCDANNTPDTPDTQPDIAYHDNTDVQS